MIIDDISRVYQGEDGEKPVAQQERHDIWLSKLPDRLTLRDTSEYAVWEATTAAILECARTRGSSGTFLLDPEFVRTAYKPDPSIFTYDLHDSLPRSVQYRMLPSDESLVYETGLAMADFLGVKRETFETQRKKVENDLEEGLGKDPSKFRTITNQHILLHRFAQWNEDALDRLSERTWPIDESVALYETACNNIPRRTVSE